MDNNPVSMAYAQGFQDAHAALITMLNQLSIENANLKILVSEIQRAAYAYDTNFGVQVNRLVNAHDKGNLTP